MNRLQLIQRVGIGIVLALGVYLRVSGLETQVFWHDEVYTRIFASGYQSQDWQKEVYSGEVLDVATLQRYQHLDPERSVADTVRGLARDEPQHPPIYYVLARIWVGWFGDGVANLRLLSAIIGLLAFPAIYWLGLELFGSRRIAWLSVVLFSVSPFFVLYAREAREYVLWSVWTLLSMAALLRALRLTEAEDTTRPRLVLAWGCYSLTVAAGLYTAFSMAAPILAQVLFVILRARGRFIRTSVLPALALTVSALLFLPWALILGEHYESFQASMAWSREIVIPRSELLSTFALNLSRPVMDFWPDYEHAGVGLAVGMVVLLAVVATGIVARRAPGQARLLLLSTIALPILLLLVPDLVSGGIRSISTRYLTPSLLGVLLAFAFWLGREQTGARTRTAAALLTAGVILTGAASSLSNIRRESVWTKGVSVGLPEVARNINASSGSAPLIVANREQHNPGNLLALANLLDPGTKVQVRDLNLPYRVPPGFERVFLFSPTDLFRETLEEREGVSSRLLHRDLYLQLWILVRPSEAQRPG